MLSFCWQVNSFVSTSALNRNDKQYLKSLKVVDKKISFHGNSRAVCWNFFGQLIDRDEKVVNENRLYCKLCLNDQQESGDGGHISAVSNFAYNTSSGNLNQHLVSKHEVDVNSHKHTQTIMKFVTRKNARTDEAASSHEFNRDLLVWFARDLIPFETVTKEGFGDFFSKYMPDFKLPSPDTLRCSALNDIYVAMKQSLKLKLNSVNSICLMFDGWTDKYRRRNYLGVRISFLYEWQYCIATLGCHVLMHHTAKDISEHVVSLLSAFFPNVKGMFITSCHDGAANMVKASKLLRVEYYNHCVAHAMHLLLTTDSLNKIDEVKEVLDKCKQIVSTLHFKSMQMENEIQASCDKETINIMMDKLGEINQVLDMDNEVAPQLESDADIPGDPCTSNRMSHEPEEGESSKLKEIPHRHQTVKSATPTRWNSTLFMVESIVQLSVEVNNTLKRCGYLPLCLNHDELNFLAELVVFLKPFCLLTELFSSSFPSLSTVPLLKLKIKKLCKVSGQDDHRLKAIKLAVLDKLDSRFPESEHIKLQQLLDPETKSLIPRPEATAILEKAINDCKDRGLIKFDPPLCQPTTSAMQSSCDETEREAKRRRVRSELLNEMLSSPSNIESEVQWFAYIERIIVIMLLFCLFMYLCV